MYHHSMAVTSFGRSLVNTQQSPVNPGWFPYPLPIQEQGPTAPRMSKGCPS